MQQQRLQGITVGLVEDLQALANAINVNRIKPIVEKTFRFDQAKEAFTHTWQAALISGNLQSKSGEARQPGRG
jgi:hypothetical protein